VKIHIDMSFCRTETHGLRTLAMQIIPSPNLREIE